MDSTDLYSQNSPAALRSPLKRKNISNDTNTPKSNRYITKHGYKKGMSGAERSNLNDSRHQENDDYEITSSFDALEQELLSDDFPALNKDVKVEVVEDEDLDALDLGLDEDSSQSWATRQTIWDRKQEVEQKIKQEKPEISVRVKRELSISPVPTSSGRTTPDNEIQPPLKKGREHEADHRGFRTRNRNRKRDFSRKTEVVKERETDETIIARRQKQIDYGKVSVDYQEYSEEISHSERRNFHPRTPDKYQKCSRRSFDQQIKIWKRKIHHWKDEDLLKKELFKPGAVERDEQRKK